MQNNVVNEKKNGIFIDFPFKKCPTPLIPSALIDIYFLIMLFIANHMILYEISFEQI